jgi:LacI family transcriptional regulator
VAQPVQAIGEHAARLILDRLERKIDGPTRRQVLQGRLTVRNSCRPLSSNAKS